VRRLQRHGRGGGHEPVRCGTCGGAGEVRRVQRSFLGQLVSVMPCPDCGGEGQRIEQAVRGVRRPGRAAGSREIEVNGAAGRLDRRLPHAARSGQCRAPRGGPRGDVLVVLEVEEDPRFLRDGADLIHELPITFSQAALGAEVEVPTIDGSARLRIAPGTQSGRLLRMRGRACRTCRARRGDLIIRVVVWTPTSSRGAGGAAAEAGAHRGAGPARR
jgi:molecular chaperone DnaJ